ncbi:hypothetical protein ABZ235_28270 [Streptomyces canus]|uniref:hypothetical protein n=1 Tax=Streptomyces canus TaxID=58343 RepID=UPI0033AFD5A1
MNAKERTVLVDVTLRDGGYVNGHSWTVSQAKEVLVGCGKAGIPYAEVGYLRPARHIVDGSMAPSASCPPWFLEQLGDVDGCTELVVMAHATDIVPADLSRLAEFGVRMVRMPTRPGSVKELAPYAAAAREAGMVFSANLIRVSELSEQQVVDAAASAERNSVDIFYIADSNGSLFPEDAGRLCGLVREATDIELGFHAHDGISMGFANALAAMRQEFRYIDASLCGMGKGGGNLSMELIAAYLRSREGRDVSVTPLAETAARLLTPWKGDHILAGCESIASGILDLNMDDLKAIHDEDSHRLFSMLDGMRSAG